MCQGYKWDLSDEEAQELGRRSIVAAGHRDAYSGNTVNLFHVRENGWEFISEYTLGSLQRWGHHPLPVLAVGDAQSCTELTWTAENYDLSELWYEYEEKKKADLAAASAAAAGGVPIDVE